MHTIQLDSHDWQKPVNVGLQMFFAVIPILYICASYKIQKLRLGLLIFWAGGTIVQIVQFFVFFGEEYYVKSRWLKLPESLREKDFEKISNNLDRIL